VQNPLPSWKDPQGVTEDSQQVNLTTARENCALFSAVAARYDLLNHLLSFGLDKSWRRRAVAALAPGSDCYLDIGCGTGDIALEILRQSPASRVIGIDPCEAMLAIGWKKVIAAGRGGEIDLQTGEVLEMKFPEACFAGAITAFCLRNVTDRRLALLETRRVLRPGARLVILELATPPRGIMRRLFRVYEKGVMPVWARLSQPAAYNYLIESMAAFPPPEKVLGLLRAIGFQELRHTPLTGGLVNLFVGRRPVSG
jgi:demethylmenaquinone methyltransferase/2-methoxy-6-polyprenyl-1,4-benzoquinol methylase